MLHEIDVNELDQKDIPFPPPSFPSFVPAYLLLSFWPSFVPCFLPFFLSIYFFQFMYLFFFLSFSFFLFLSFFFFLSFSFFLFLSFNFFLFSFLSLSLWYFPSFHFPFLLPCTFPCLPLFFKIVLNLFVLINVPVLCSFFLAPGTCRGHFQQKGVNTESIIENCLMELA